jgi:phosphoribosylaminoimidazole-succinocarboxamide synthase
MIPILEMTELKYPGLSLIRRGKSKDIYQLTFNDTNYCLLVFTDRVSVFDTQLPYFIPYKGFCIANLTKVFIQDLFRGSWFIQHIHPNMIIGNYLQPIKLEVIVRRYLSGSLFKRYTTSRKPFQIDSLHLKGGLYEHHRLEDDVVEFTTKSLGKDRFISEEEIVNKELLSSDEIRFVKMLAKQTFTKCFSQCYENGILLANLKLEFGKSTDNTICLIDTLCNPDSSLLLDKDSYPQHFAQSQPQLTHSKDIIRNWYESEQIARYELTKVTPPENILGSFQHMYTNTMNILNVDAYTQLPNKSALTTLYSNDIMEAELDMFIKSISPKEPI